MCFTETTRQDAPTSASLNWEKGSRCFAIAIMVWFQCEDCGENLKKPKLANHFRGCSAQKLSCIDCGVIFTQQSIQGHTQCLSEAEKYGPKPVGFIKKETITSKELVSDGLDVSLGLSTRSPWTCSLCSVKATSQETLLLHSQGKKHRSKVRSMSSKVSNTENWERISTAKEDKTAVCLTGLGEKTLEEFKLENGLRKDFSQVDDGARQPVCTIHSYQPEANSTLISKTKEQTVAKGKKRKFSRDQDTLPTEAKIGMKDGEACLNLIGKKGSKAEHGGCNKHRDNPSKNKRQKGLTDEVIVATWSSLVKWKKLIKRALQSAPDGSLKLKQLRRSILPPAMEVVKNYGCEVNKESFSRELERQIQAREKFIIEGKVVRLAV